jgi:hypothetical protein
MSLAVVPNDAAPEPRWLHVRPWVDPVLDQQGHDPRSAYVETFWLPLLGPSATLLARQLAAGLERSPEGFGVAADDAARSLGLGAKAGRRSPFNRTVLRLAQFRILHLEGPDVLLARRKLPGLTRSQVGKLPAPLQEAHEAYKAAERQAPALPVMRERARTLALTLLQVGETVEEVDEHLRRLRFHPSLCSEALHWALERMGGCD